MQTVPLEQVIYVLSVFDESLRAEDGPLCTPKCSCEFSLLVTDSDDLAAIAKEFF